jgi:hypothetical protein
MPSVAHYRELALECEKLAAKTAEGDYRALLIRVAERLRALATELQMEARERAEKRSLLTARHRAP